MMRQFSGAIWVAALVAILLLVYVSAVKRALALEPGTAGDPVVTKSYVEDLYGWKLRTLHAGEAATFEVGAEVVLRSGRARVVAGPGGGLADLTRGAELPGGSAVPPNHYLLSPASDGRGIRAESTVVLLMRGWLP